MNSNKFNNNYKEDDYIFSKSQRLKSQRLNAKREDNIQYKYIIIVILILYIVTFFILWNKINNYRIKYNLDNTRSNFNEPFLPDIENELPKKFFFKSYYNNSNIRYNFKELFLKRKIFKINYSYLPYENVKKS